MAFTTEEVRQIGDIVVEVTTPMFEHVIETLDRRIDGVESRLDGVESRLDSVESHLTTLESEFRDFKEETRSKFAVLEEKIDRIEQLHLDRFENVEDDVRHLYHLVNKLENGTKEEKQFAESAIIDHLPAIYKAITLLAKKHHIEL